MLQLKALSKGLQLIIDCTADVPQYVETDERKLREVLINLLGNAIKFTGKGSVTLRVRAKQGNENRSFSENSKEVQPTSYCLTFEVEDTGPGIALEERNALFTPFGQTETGRNSQEGTGLGLAISQKFVQLMGGGDITVSSTLGKGTTFAFNIQIATSSASEIQTAQETRKVIGLAPDQPDYRILIVEDNLENRLLLVKLLTSVGFSVCEAENGQEAIALLSSYSPHLILMDMRMPVMNGYEATRQIKAHLKGQATAVIALTASALEEDREAILSAGCDDFMCKPFREESLWEKIAQQLGVHYLYEESEVRGEDEAVRDESIPSDESLKYHLSQMPREWVEKLYQAALKGLDHVIIQLLEQIPETHVPLANTLEDWANNFLFDRVIDLIQLVQFMEPECILGH
jgi:two-component system sensor histidine kinase/response regulator